MRVTTIVLSAWTVLANLGCEKSPAAGPAPIAAATPAGPHRQGFAAVMPMRLSDWQKERGPDATVLVDRLIPQKEGSPPPQRRIVQQSGDLMGVEIIETGLQDDSVAAQKTLLELVRDAASGQWSVSWAGQQQQCQPNRGHSEWSAEPCL